MLGDELAAEMRLEQAASAVVEAARFDLSSEGHASVSRVPGGLMERLAEALNLLHRARNN